MRWGLLNFVGDYLRQGYRFESTVRLPSGTYRNNFAPRNFHGGVALPSAESELVGQTARTLFLDQDLDLHLVLKPKRCHVVALRVDSRQTYLQPRTGQHHRMA